MNILNLELRVPVWMAGSMAVMVLALALGAYHYQALYEATDKALVALEGSVQTANDTAARKLARLTAERDAMQAKLDERAEAQEKTDGAAKAEIARLAGELERRPVRVRYLPAPGWDSGGSTAGKTAIAANAGAGSPAAADGVLPPENSRRLGIALTEVETLSAAYNSCRASLISRTAMNGSMDGTMTLATLNTSQADQRPSPW